jgi:uncharacterized protein (DUF305 family)
VNELSAATSARRGGGFFLLGLATCLLATVAMLLFVGGADLPTDASPDAGFARDMATHHAQAAEMAFLVRDRSSDERLRTLAYDIIVTQTAQRGVFMGWLQQWGLSQSSAHPRMAWMDRHLHTTSSAAADAGGPGVMPGMASDADLARLRQAGGRDAEVLFLQLMIRHHEGGVEMARAILTESARDEVATLARNIESSQAGEITLMREMLVERGAQPMAERE